MINAIIDVGDPPAEVGAHGPSELQPVESAGSRPAMAANSSTSPQLSAKFLEYLRRMTVASDAKIRPEQWGGFAEARVAAQLLNMSMFIVGHLGGHQYQLYTDPTHPANPPVKACCLVYSGGNHFDALLANAPHLCQRLGGPGQ